MKTGQIDLEYINAQFSMIVSDLNLYVRDFTSTCRITEEFHVLSLDHLRKVPKAQTMKPPLKPKI